MRRRIIGSGASLDVAAAWRGRCRSGPCTLCPGGLAWRLGTRLSEPGRAGTGAGLRTLRCLYSEATEILKFKTQLSVPPPASSFSSPPASVQAVRSFLGGSPPAGPPSERGCASVDHPTGPELGPLRTSRRLPAGYSPTVTAAKMRLFET